MVGVLTRLRGGGGLDHFAQLEQIDDELGVGLALERPGQDIRIEQVPAVA